MRPSIPVRLLPFLYLVALSVACVHADTVTPPPVTQEISSFGACVSDGHVYVYGGHTGKTHQHSRDNLSADFLRYPLDPPGAAWEKLPEDKAVQGTALVGWNGLVIRIGGMYATNARGEKSELFSTDSVRCYDPEAKAWSDWPSLPDKISSHDAVVVDDVLYVAGGWKLDGERKGAWHEHGWSLDLNRRDQGWKDLPPMPGVLRGGTMASAGGEIWWVGGLGDEDGASNAVFAYDPRKGSWREGPEVPTASRAKAFGSSTFAAGGRLFNSGGDGVLYSLDPAADAWTATPVSHRHGRIFHRSLPVGDGLFWTIAGAAEGGHRSDIEVLPIPEQAPVASGAAAWQSFRGGSNNELAAREMAGSWSDDANIAWRASLPGYGQSTPVFRDYVLAPSSEKGQTQLLRRGETDRRVVWKADGKTAASFASPVFTQGQIVLVSKAGIASGLDWRTGEELWNLRLPDGCWATPVVVGSDLYFFSTAGITMVATLTPDGLQEQRTNQLTVGTSKVYGVIPAGDRWIVRTGEEVTAIAKPEES